MVVLMLVELLMFHYPLILQFSINESKIKSLKIPSRDAFPSDISNRADIGVGADIAFNNLDKTKT